MTRDQFIDSYLRNSGLSPSDRTNAGFSVDDVECIVLPCYCGDEQCHGWAMIDNTPKDIARHKQIYGAPSISA